MEWNWDDAFVIGRIIIAFVIIYRAYKWWSRRCTCGSLWFLRFHKMADEGQGKYSPMTFRHCFGCGDFIEIKSDTKRFNRLELWWRQTFHWQQFSNIAESMRRAQILVDQRTYRASMTRSKLSPLLCDLKQKPLPRGRAAVLMNAFRLRNAGSKLSHR